MKKYILFLIMIFILASPTKSFANKEKDEHKNNPISPKKVERVLDVMSKEAKKNAPGIKELVREYMKSVKKFAREMNETFGDILYDMFE